MNGRFVSSFVGLIHEVVVKQCEVMEHFNTQCRVDDIVYIFFVQVAAIKASAGRILFPPNDRIYSIGSYKLLGG